MSPIVRIGKKSMIDVVAVKSTCISMRLLYGSDKDTFKGINSIPLHFEDKIASEGIRNTMMGERDSWNTYDVHYLVGEYP